MATKPDTCERARRQLLKGLGLGGACLPLLHASRTWAAGETPPKRFVCALATEGYRQDAWKPKTGSLMTQMLPASSAPLEALKSYLVYLPDMTNPNCGTGPRNGHEAHGTIFWGGPPAGPKFREAGGKTLDQVIADGLGAAQNGRSSLHFGVQVDRKPSVGTTGARRCFWRGAGQPINPEMNPYKTYADLFAGAAVNPGAGEDSKRLLAKRKSLLDFVGRSLTGFKTRVAREDKEVIDGHLQSIRDLESRLSAPGLPVDGSCRTPSPQMFDDAAILSTDKLYPDLLRAYFDIVVSALRCGVSKVVTLQVADCSGNSVNFGAFVEGIPPRNVGGDAKTPFRNWHDLGHRPIGGDGVDHKKIVDRWWMNELAGFLNKLKASPEPGGSLLDNSLVLWGNHMESGDNHATQAVPWLLAGKAGGALQTGQCAASAGKSTNDAMAEICRVMGVQPAAHYGSGIPGLRV